MCCSKELDSLADRKQGGKKQPGIGNCKSNHIEFCFCRFRSSRILCHPEDEVYICCINMYILYDASQSVFPRRMSTEYSHLELRGIIFRVRGRKEIDHSKHAPLPSMQMDKSRASFWLGEPTFVSKYKATKNSHSMLSAKLRREFMTCWQIKQLLILYTISLLDLPLEISFYQHCSLAYFSMR